MQLKDWIFRQLNDLRVPLPGELVVHVVLGAALGAIAGSVVSALIDSGRVYGPGMIIIIVVHILLVFIYIFACRLAAVFIGGGKFALSLAALAPPALLLAYLDFALGGVAEGLRGAEMFSFAIGVAWLVLLLACGVTQLLVQRHPEVRRLFQ
ncbi:MAG: hypothetical protein NXI12_03095 [Alphaproteobacteria bacterium]|nr:hypothetical protein [Alphaproteobacteria bacterium]